MFEVFLCSRPCFHVLLGRLAKCHYPHHQGWCKIFRGWVKFVTEYTVFCCKFNLLSQLIIFWGVRVPTNVVNVTLRVFCSEIIEYFHCILIILFLRFFSSFSALFQIWYC